MDIIICVLMIDLLFYYLPVNKVNMFLDKKRGFLVYLTENLIIADLIEYNLIGNHLG